ncbi:glycogen synthase [Thiospirochaeta perfilievii]|uniref:starch synthase n=1 Tax=Thiospirochaeta perfilievii TaxID=252967 RepID=A0A5C1Q995_9SPIO|nr:glycogen/starch synthase [Thiospirochaeta perfilievii]QEN03489.1 glycogen synthase [Thiospirochaeta perfilievii]
MKVLYFALECKPFSKVGGVGDVALELPLALKNKGIDIEIVTPYYSSVDESWIEKNSYQSYIIPFKNKNGEKKDEKVTVHKSTYKDIDVTFIKNTTYFEGDYGVPYVFSEHTPFYDDFIRFHFFSLASAKFIEETKPDIVHVNDWGLGFLLGKLKYDNNSALRLLTIHNNSYQGNMWIPAIRNWSVMEYLYNKDSRKVFKDPRNKWNSVNPLKLGIECADAVNAVSPTYKKEMLKKDCDFNYFSGANGLEKSIRKHGKRGTLYGVLNGFEYKEGRSYQEVLEEKKDAKKRLSSHFKNPENFLIGFVGRAVEQKFKLLQEIFNGKSVLEHITDNKNINIAILASGLPEYEEFLEQFKDLENVSVTLAFDKELASTISIGCDLFLMPSLYEPCGITQMESLSNATPPLVRFVGGLKDTVRSYKKSGGTGFGFNGLTKRGVLKGLVSSVNEAVDVYYNTPGKFDLIRQEAFKQRFLWSDSAIKYIEIYEDLLQGNNG